ncbi:hypothetical protein BVIET440_100091 [Burkholderia vietnamiensis]|nr:hypothetical protein BVI2075_180094 [Burkholderia vietnamiensis]CAG9224832.1 hypothetical protein BVI1335_530074 [Burkholderia vietnamiensis]
MYGYRTHSVLMANNHQFSAMHRIDADLMKRYRIRLIVSCMDGSLSTVVMRGYGFSKQYSDESN